MEQSSENPFEAENIDKRKEQLKRKIKKFLGNKYTLILIGILIFAFIIYLNYFSMTKNQTLWWDEAEYMSMAKHWASDVPYEINPARPVLLPFLASILYRLGFGELSIKFSLELIPLLLSILLMYLLVFVLSFFNLFHYIFLYPKKMLQIIKFQFRKASEIKVLEIAPTVFPLD